MRRQHHVPWDKVPGLHQRTLAVQPEVLKGQEILQRSLLRLAFLDPSIEKRGMAIHSKVARDIHSDIPFQVS